MDRNTAVATVLIALIMVVWLFWMTPPPAAPDLNPDGVPVDTSAVAAAPDAAPEREAQAARQAPATPALTDSTLAAVLSGTAETLTVETDLYVAELSSKGATLTSFTLKNYVKADRTTPVQLVDSTNAGALGLVFTSPQSHLIDTRAFYFSSNARQERLVVGNDPVTVVFEANIGTGTLRQTYTFAPDTYEIGLAVTQENPSAFSTDEGYELVWNGALPFSEADKKEEAQRAGAYARSGGEVENVTLIEDPYEELSLRGDIDWMAVKSKYFTAAVIPDERARGVELISERIGELDAADMTAHFETRMLMPVASGEADVFRIYLGPVEFIRLSAYDLGLYEMVDYGWDFFEWITRGLARFIFIPAFTYLGGILPNYGLVIIILAIFVKLLVYPLTKSSYKSMARMRELQPKMEAIKEKHGDNPQKQQEAMMKMYRETGVNPLGGCLPMVLQYPIIIALWQFLPQSIQIRQQGFLWAQDLSAPDAIINLPFMIPLYGDYVAGFTLLMGISMVVQMRIQMASQPSNPQTKIFTYVFPVMIFAIFNSLASGLSLYYLCFNVLTAFQQKYINMSLEKEREAEADAPTAKGRNKAASAKRSRTSKNGTDKGAKRGKNVRTR